MNVTPRRWRASATSEAEVRPSRGRALDAAGYAPGMARWAAVVRYLLVLAGSLAALLLVIGSPEVPTLPDHLPSPFALEVWLQSPGTPLEMVSALARDAAWLVWLWAALSLLIELLLVGVEATPARGADWVRALRRIADRAALPLARRAIAVSLSVQLGMRAVGPVLGAVPTPIVAYAASGTGVSVEPISAPAEQPAETTASSDTYTVQVGDTLWSISERVYGTGHEYPLLIAANAGRRMTDGRVFDERGVIHPGWVLRVPQPNREMLRTEDGRRIYVVQPGDCLSGIAARLLGDAGRWPEIFELSRGASTPDGRHRLTSPNLIWPDLPVVLPPDAAEDTQTPAEDAGAPAEEPPQPAAPIVSTPEPPTPVPAPTETVVRPTATAEPVLPTATPLAPKMLVHPSDEAATGDDTPAVELEPVAPSTAPVEAPPPAALSLAAGLGALAVGGGLVGLRLVRRRRRLEPLADVPESDVKVEEGFARADPSRDLAERLTGHDLAERDPVTLLVAHVVRFLRERGSDELAAQTQVLLARHGRSSTTLELVTSLPQQPRLLALAPEVASALEPGVAAEAELTPDGDVALRVRGLRQASLQLTRAMRPLEAILRAVPTLVPVGVLADRQEFSANWGVLGHVLVASSTGTGATAILTSVLARVAARRTPAELQVRIIAPPRALPAAVLSLPHQLGPAVDPQDQDAVAEALSSVRAELDRRLLAGSSTGQPELVVVVAELLDLEPYVGLLGQLGERGAACGVRLLAASTRPGSELAAHPLLPDFSTRLVQRTADEDESVVLLGTADAAYVGGGGRLLFRVEQRTPVELYAYRVAPADLDRLVEVMTTAYGAGANRRGPVAPSSPAGNHDGQELAVVTDEGANGTLVQEEEPVVVVSPRPAEPLSNGHGKASSTEALASTVTPNGCEGLLPPEQEALLEVRCFAGPRVLRDNEELWPAAAPNREQKASQLLLFLAAHSADGVDRDKAAEALLGEDESADPAGTLRQWRKRVRTSLGRLVPDLPEEDLFQDSGRSWRLNPGWCGATCSGSWNWNAGRRRRAATIPSRPMKPCALCTSVTSSIAPRRSRTCGRSRRGPRARAWSRSTARSTRRPRGCWQSGAPRVRTIRSGPSVRWSCTRNWFGWILRASGCGRRCSGCMRVSATAPHWNATGAGSARCCKTRRPMPSRAEAPRSCTSNCSEASTRNTRNCCRLVDDEGDTCRALIASRVLQVSSIPWSGLSRGFGDAAVGHLYGLVLLLTATSFQACEKSSSAHGRSARR